MWCLLFRSCAALLKELDVDLPLPELSKYSLSTSSSLASVTTTTFTEPNVRCAHSHLFCAIVDTCCECTYMCRYAGEQRRSASGFERSFPPFARRACIIVVIHLATGVAVDLRRSCALRLVHTCSSSIFIRSRYGHRRYLTSHMDESMTMDGGGWIEAYE